VRFTVLDAGDAVKGAKVKAGGKSGTTDARGRVTLTLTSRKAVRARATESGYAAANRRLAVRR
jgi:ribosomal protein L16/L10AE